MAKKLTPAEQLAYDYLITVMQCVCDRPDCCVQLELCDVDQRRLDTEVKKLAGIIEGYHAD